MSQKTAVNSHDNHNNGSLKASTTVNASWEYLMPKRKERMASYIRESDISLADSTTIESQAKAVREYGEKQGYAFNIQEHEYREAISAYSVPYMERKRLLDMLEAAKRGEFDVLVVTEIRALGRKQVEIFVIYDQLQKYHIRLETITEKFEDSAMGRLILSLRAAFSEIEHDQILLRLERGRRDRLEISHALNGHCHAGYGHIFVDSDREQNASYDLDMRIVYIDEDEQEWTPADVIRLMRDLVFQGYSVRKIALSLTTMGIPNPDFGKSRKGKANENVWLWATVHRILTDPRIMGVVYANKSQKQNGKRIKTPEKQMRLPDCPPIITPEEFSQIQHQLQINKEESRRNNKQPHEEMGLFRAGYCLCGICYRRMIVRHPNLKYRKPNSEYACCKATGRTDLYHNHNTTIVVPILDNEGWKRAIEVIQNPALVRQRVALYRQEHKIVIDPEDVHQAIATLDTEMKNLFSLARHATDDSSIARLGQLLNELEAQKQQAQALLYDMEEEQEEQEKIEAEIVRFEQRANEVRPQLGNPDYNPTYQEQRLAIRIIGLCATVFPATGNWPFRCKFDLAPPEIMKLLRKNCVSHRER